MSISALCQKRLTSLPEPIGILNEIQNHGREALIKQGEPKCQDESWRQSDLKRIERFLSLPFAAKRNESCLQKYPNIKEKSHNLLQLIIDPLKEDWEDISLPKGIEFLNNKDLRLHLESSINLCESNANWPVAINRASTNKVIGIKIKGIDLPSIELIFPAVSNSFNSTRVMVIIEENSKLELNQVIIGAKGSAQSNLIEMKIGRSAEVNHGIITLGEGDGILMATQAIAQQPFSNYSLTSLQQGWYFSRFEPKIVQVHGQAKTSLKSLQLSKNKEEVSTHSFVRFDGPEGQLDQLNKAVADEKAHSIFNGAIEVPRIAQKTEASQLSRNLILSKRAKIDTKPELEIIADDVRCTHGATISQLQEEEIFYLRSRGIDANKANSLLLESFYKEVLNTLPLYFDRWSFLNDLIQRKEA